MHPLLQKLTGGDRRSIGRADEVVTEVLREPKLFPVLVEGLFQDNSLVKMRAFDVLEKATKKDSTQLIPFKGTLIELAQTEVQNEARWHLAQILPRLNLTHEENIVVVNALLTYLSGSSSIVKTSVMQAFSDISETDKELREELLAHIKELTVIGTPAMKARGNKLLGKRKR